MPADPQDPTRRQLLTRAGSGAAGLGLLSLFGSAAHAADDPAAAVQRALGPHLPTRAKHCIFLFMFGGPSQMDLFDYKPELQKRHGQTVELERRRRQVRPAVLLGSRRSFAQYGETGQWCSDALPLLSQHMDKLAVIKSLHTDSFAHGSAVLQMNSSFIRQGSPSLGSWLQHGLGTDNPDLPGYVVMHDPRGGPISGAANWASGYMPAAYQGTLFRATGDPLLYMTPEPSVGGRWGMTDTMKRTQLQLLQDLNASYAATRTGYSDLPARTAAHELALRMEHSAPDALNIEDEDEETLAMYAVDGKPGEHRLSIGPATFGRQCLIARRLIERGVRYVQIYQGGGHQQQTWDAHSGVEENLSIHCPEIDRPVSALLTDLERTGLLDETLVIWGGEFGRQPVSQQAGDGQTANADGRDHNPKAFTMWLAGAGIKPGSYGETDELGAMAVVDRYHVRELHATILRLMGLDYRKLTYHYGGLDRRMTGPEDVRIIDDILA